MTLWGISMRRRLVQSLSILSVLLAVAVVVFWVRSGSAMEFFGTNSVLVGREQMYRRLSGVWSHDGRLMIGVVTSDHAFPSYWRQAPAAGPTGLVHLRGGYVSYEIDPERRTPTIGGPMARLGFYWNSR